MFSNLSKSAYELERLLSNNYKIRDTHEVIAERYNQSGFQLAFPLKTCDPYPFSGLLHILDELHIPVDEQIRKVYYSNEYDRHTLSGTELPIFMHRGFRLGMESSPASVTIHHVTFSSTNDGNVSIEYQGDSLVVSSTEPLKERRDIATLTLSMDELDGQQILVVNPHIE